MQNLNLLFNKTYFSELEVPVNDGARKRNDERFISINRMITASTFTVADREAIIDEATVSKLCTHRFIMKTLYPGLLVGTGYTHEATQGSNNCIKLGFSFDYVTGQPYIPGSSVKGMLGSCFNEPSVICEIMQELGFSVNLTDQDVNELKNQIFEGNRDVFYDAVIRAGDEKQRILGEDYITPHGNDETKSPNPLLMLKILPDVKFEFRFRLTDSKVSEECIISAAVKAKLFMELLAIFGIGAKTHVGYGILECSNSDGADAAVENDGTASDSDRA